jgi:hypothetical protein
MPERHADPIQETGQAAGRFPLESFDLVARLAREVLRERGLTDEQIERELQRAIMDEV